MSRLGVLGVFLGAALALSWKHAQTKNVTCLTAVYALPNSIVLFHSSMLCIVL